MKGAAFVYSFTAVITALAIYAVVIDAYDRKCACCLRRWALWTDKDGDRRCRRHRVAR